MTKVAVFGAHGRVGREIVAAVRAADDLELVATIDPGGHDTSHEAGEAALADVAVDFTTPGAVMENLKFCIAHGVAAVVGTTGFTAERLDTVRGWLADAGDDAPPVLIAPNFAIGAVLLMRFAALAAPYYDSVEIMELHHPNKLDAPSGTARHTAALIAEARRDRGPAPDATDDAVSLPGARGVAVDGVPIHSIRVQGMLAHEEVLLGTTGETLSLRHDSRDRTSFVPGVLLAVRKVQGLSGLSVGLDAVL